MPDLHSTPFTPETSRPRQIGLACRTATSCSQAIRPEHGRCDPHTMDAQAAPMAPSFRRALAAGVIALVTWVASPADASAATEPDQGLVGQVPAALASTCEWASVDGIANAEAAVDCTPPASSGVTSVTYSASRTPRSRLVLRGRQGADSIPISTAPTSSAIPRTRTTRRADGRDGWRARPLTTRAP